MPSFSGSGVLGRSTLPMSSVAARKPAPRIAKTRTFTRSNCIVPLTASVSLSFWPGREAQVAIACSESDALRQAKNPLKVQGVQLSIRFPYTFPSPFPTWVRRRERERDLRRPQVFQPPLELHGFVPQKCRYLGKRAHTFGCERFGFPD